jgi:superfamily II DNA/RNA helicase
MYQLSKWKWVPRVGSHAMAHRLLQPAVRFAIEDCQDLPECTYQFRDVPLSPVQQDAYDELKRTAVLMTKQGAITAANEAVVRLKLKQICAGAIYGPEDPHTGERSIHRVDATARLEEVRQIIEQTSHKVIVFAPFTSVVNLLHSELKDDYSCELINGQTSQKKRNEIFADFQKAKDPRIIVADPGTMSHGLTLTAAATVVWYSPTDKTEQFLQANKRIDRPGQQNHTTIVQIAGSALEREIYRRLKANESMMGLTLLLAREGTHGSHDREPDHGISQDTGPDRGDHQALHGRDGGGTSTAQKAIGSA